MPGADGSEGSEEVEERGGGGDEQMRAGSAGTSNISGAWAAVPSVRSMRVPTGLVKASGADGGRRAWGRRR
jgi:hypothetical protein